MTAQAGNNVYPQNTAHWAALLGNCGVRSAQIVTWAPAAADSLKPGRFSAGESELDDFLGNMLHETNMLRNVVENLNYSPERIRELGLMYGPNSRWAAAARQANDLAGQPEALAEVLYSGRFGNTAPGDGWNYRGRGIPQITFKSNYEFVGDLIGQDLVGLPGLLEQPRFALDAGLAWWEKKIPDSILGDDRAVRIKVQGSSLGLAECVRIANKARASLAGLV